MTDIVERLRGIAEDWFWVGDGIHESINQGADEIERLRGACKNASSYISVRDQFAIAALPVAAKSEGRLLSDDIARMAYELADAMIKARAALGEEK